MANEAKIRATVARIERDPSAFDMGTWICQTSACFAGHALIEEFGEQYGLDLGPYEDTERIRRDIVADNEIPAEFVFLTNTWEDMAAAVLELSAAERYIFYYMRDHREDGCECETSWDGGCTPVDLPLLKKKITELTGIEFKEESERG